MTAELPNVPIARKPSWLSRESFDELLLRYGGMPYCAVTGEMDDLSVDHIVPRYLGGTDDPSNLQFLVNRINAKKGIKPDTYWSRSFYWDKMPNVDSFRGGQRLLFNELLEREDWFGRPISQISRNLYLNAWVVGAGKTLGIAAGAWAANYVIRKRWGAAVRADKVLVVTKEQAVRDQIAVDLRTDIVKYGICGQAPRVAVIKDGSQFGQDTWLESHDVIVTCVQQLWERSAGSGGKIERLLAKFPVIAFDEPHFAADRVNGLVEAATNSICFGFTGTPIDKAGALLGRMVGLTVYGYDTAVRVDQGLKWIDSDPELLGQFVREVGITEAELLENGEKTTTSDTDHSGYNKNIEPAKTVARAVIDEMKRRDQLRIADEKIAPHRDPAAVVKAGFYLSHGMVICDSIPTANMLCRNTNDLLANDPAQYPVSDGWRAEVVHTERTDGDQKLAGKKLTTDHAWLRSKNQNYQVDDKCARLLFVVGIGREGVNNPPCGPIGIATSQSSVVEVVQRAIGRQLRAVVSSKDGKLQVPPAPLDQVLIITHRAFNNVETIQHGIKFVCDMEEHLAELPTIDGLETGVRPTAEELTRDANLPIEVKLDIVGRLNGLNAAGDPVAVDDVVLEVAGLDTGPRVDRIRDWALKVREDPAGARREIRFYSNVEPLPIVMRETVKHEPSDTDLERHMRIHHPDKVGRYIPVSDQYREVLGMLFREHAERFHLPPLTSGEHIEDIRKQITGHVTRRLGSHYAGDRQTVHQLVGSAVKHKLGVPRDVKAKNNSDWDTPQVHAILHRPDVQAEIVGWVAGRLIDMDLCPALAALRDPALVSS